MHNNQLKNTGELGLLPNGKPSMSESMEFYQCAKSIFEAAKLSCQS
jgi:hypothetical protein